MYRWGCLPSEVSADAAGLMVQGDTKQLEWRRHVQWLSRVELVSVRSGNASLMEAAGKRILHSTGCTDRWGCRT